MLSKWTVLSGLRTSVFVCTFVTLVAALSLSGCGGSSKPPSVSVTASVATVDGTDTSLCQRPLQTTRAPAALRTASPGV
jgi:hypothetical protein